MLRDIKEKVLSVLLDLNNTGLIFNTWGNVSEIDASRRYIVIKPSGVHCYEITPEDMVVVAVNTGEIVEGRLLPSTDTPTHLELYRNFDSIGGIVHTHSVNAVAFAQAGMGIPILGTTQADYFYGDIPCTRALTEEQILNDYEENTGKVIVETIRNIKCHPLSMPGVLVRNHGPFTWGKDSVQAAVFSGVLEKLAEIDIKTMILNEQSEISKYLIDKHFRRKNGPDSYYGQKNKSS